MSNGNFINLLKPKRINTKEDALIQLITIYEVFSFESAFQQNTYGINDIFSTANQYINECSKKLNDKYGDDIDAKLKELCNKIEEVFEGKSSKEKIVKQYRYAYNEIKDKLSELGFDFHNSITESFYKDIREASYNSLRYLSLVENKSANDDPNNYSPLVENKKSSDTLFQNEFGRLTLLSTYTTLYYDKTKEVDFINNYYNTVIVKCRLEFNNSKKRTDEDKISTEVDELDKTIGFTFFTDEKVINELNRRREENDLVGYKTYLGFIALAIKEAIKNGRKYIGNIEVLDERKPDSKDNIDKNDAKTIRPEGIAVCYYNSALDDRVKELLNAKSQDSQR